MMSSLTGPVDVSAGWRAERLNGLEAKDEGWRAQPRLWPSSKVVFVDSNRIG